MKKRETKRYKQGKIRAREGRDKRKKETKKEMEKRKQGKEVRET